MQYFNWLGVTPAESIGLIKKISKKKIKPQDFANLEERLKKQWIINTGAEDMFDETWGMIQSCMAYGFCSAHAAAVSLDMCYGAYLKVNYPLEYYSVCFNNYADDQVRTNKLKKELEYFGIKLSDIKFRHSTSKYSYNKKENTIYKGMSSIKYIGDNVGDDLYLLKDNQYETFIDLLIDIKNTSVNSKQLEILIKLNFFSEFGKINTLLAQVEYFDKIYGKKQFKIDKLDELNIPKNIVQKHCKKQTEKIWKDFDSVELLKDIISNVEYQKTSIIDILNYQQELYGYVSYVQPDANKRLYYVSVINSTKYLTTASLYEIYSGKTRTVKMWTSQYNRNPFELGSILYIISLEKKNKKEPTGEVDPKTGKKIYKEVPDKFEFWLGKFTVKNNVEEVVQDI